MLREVFRKMALENNRRNDQKLSQMVASRGISNTMKAVKQKINNRYISFGAGLSNERTVTKANKSHHDRCQPNIRDQHGPGYGSIYPGGKMTSEAWPHPGLWYNPIVYVPERSSVLTAPAGTRIIFRMWHCGKIHRILVLLGLQVP